MAISIFAEGAFLSSNGKQDFLYTGDHPTRGPLVRPYSLIRGYQIAEAIRARLNPTKDYKKDICVYVKPEISKTADLKFEGKSQYLDVIDEWNYIEILKKNPKVIAITQSERDYTNLSEVVKNKVVFIPPHHCNFDREIRTRNKITTVGAIGDQQTLKQIPSDLKKGIEKRKLEFITFSDFSSRGDVINFYKKIDIQIVWRPFKKKLANPLNIVNAASFGIPTIALEENYFKEMGNSYIGVSDTNQFFIELDRLLASQSLYDSYSHLCLKKAENYHIEKIAKLYKRLK